MGYESFDNHLRQSRRDCMNENVSNSRRNVFIEREGEKERRTDRVKQTDRERQTDARIDIIVQINEKDTYKHKQENKRQKRRLTKSEIAQESLPFPNILHRCPDESKSFA